MGCNMKFEYTEYHNAKIDDDELLNDMKAVIKENNNSSLTIAEYDEKGKFNSSTIIRRFGTWNQALSLLGAELNNRQFSEEELLSNIEKVWVHKGKQPSRRDMDNKCISSISSGAYLRKYGKWSTALKVFIEYINAEDSNQLNTDELSKATLTAHKTARDINLRLRFKVLSRDCFKCCMCGASPAKDPSVELHIDHIIPWSKGGETTIDNLQTLCSNCNWGKSNLT